ncbi:hypothetical protein HanIR_Chr12g0581081 [Helianthus annuus]|nr:hypothetical protein HanIR_Chr12g0581081 [Helianthus annuus]
MKVGDIYLFGHSFAFEKLILHLPLCAPFLPLSFLFIFTCVYTSCCFSPGNLSCPIRALF